MAFWFWTWGAIAAVALIVAALLSRVRVRVRYSRSGSFDKLVVVVQALYGLVHVQTVVPSIMMRGFNIVYEQKNKTDAPGMKQRRDGKFKFGLHALRKYRKAFKQLQYSTRDFRRWVLATTSKVECTRWRLDATVGTGDAVTTGMATGFVWAVQGVLSAVVGELMQLRTHPHGSVIPVFSRKELTVVWEADFRIRVSAILASLLKLGVRTVKLTKAMFAWRRWLTQPERA